MTTIKCDAACPAKATTAWAKELQWLYLCTHHSNTHEANLIAQGFQGFKSQKAK